MTATDSNPTLVLDTNVPARRPRWWPEVLVIVWLCWIYDAIANLAPLRTAAAIANGWNVLHVEKALHLDPEASLDHWLAGHHGLALFTSNYYDNAHFVVTLGLVGWLYWRHAALYRHLRTSLVLINLIGMVVFWIYPLAPPRLLDPSRYVDVVASTHAFGSWHSGTLAHTANQFAAMPSLHIAWAMWSALALRRIFAGSRVAQLFWVYPGLTAVAVIATGNHYLLDVVAGAATMVLATVVADRGEGWWTSRQARKALDVAAIQSDGTHTTDESAGVYQFEAVTEAVVDVAATDAGTLLGPFEIDASAVEPFK